MGFKDGIRLSRSFSFFILICTTLGFQNCSQYLIGQNPFELSSESGVFSKSNGTGAQATVASGSVGKILAAKMVLREPLVLKASDYPHLIQENPSSGLWTDGPPHPWKDDQGNTYLNIPHSENYRFKIGNKSSATNPWFAPGSWQIQSEPIFDSRKDYVVNGVTFHRGGNCTESEYDNRIWLYGFWSTGSQVSAIAHHEWYANCSRGYNTSSGFNHHWVNGIIHLKSGDGGKSFLPQALSAQSNSSRMVVVPEPKNVQNPYAMYGFFHPSNIVKEGDYYYATTEIQDYIGRKESSGSQLVTEGFVMIRTRNVSSAEGWEIFNDQRQWVIMTKGYQGNLGQRPFIFFPREINPYTAQDISAFAAGTLRYHVGTKLWLAFGVLDGRYTILQTESLSNPQFENRQKIYVEGPGPSFPFYMTVFDPQEYNVANEFNYMNVGNQLLMFHMKDYKGYAQYDLSLVTEDITSPPPPPVEPPPPPPPVEPPPPPPPVEPPPPPPPVEPPPPPPPVEPPPSYVLTFPMSKMFGFFKVGMDIYFGGTKTYCYIGSMNQYIAMTKSEDISIVASLAALPSRLVNAGSCNLPTGLFFVGSTSIYYAEKNEYCYLPNMEFYNSFTNNFPVSRIGSQAALPAGYINRGACQ